MFPLTFFSFLTLTCSFYSVLSANTLTHRGVSIPIVRANQGRKTSEEKAAWARRLGDTLISKYNPSPTSALKRRSSTGTNELVNHYQDSSYFGSLAVGTPPIAFNVILDTGSSDMWIASSTCRSGCSNIDTFSPSESSTFNNLSTPFSITYGSGSAQGWLAEDQVQMAGFSVPSQRFGVVNAVSTGLLSNPVSGLLGLAFQTISSSRALPFWQTLVEGGVWQQPVMSFYLTRFINATHVGSEEPGGRFTMGFTDPSLHEGDVEFIPIPSGQQGYWLIPLTSLSINGNNVSLPTTNNNAAIDSGTTLIGGPPAAIDALFAQIPNSSPGSGDYEGYYTYPCSTTVSVSLSFGGQQEWFIRPEDFMLTQLTPDQCLGAFFQLNTSPGGPTWIVGDTFLKNVYSVFRYSPPAVGFGLLSTSALQLAVAGGPLPSQTIGANPTTATGRSHATRSLSRPSVSDIFLIAILTSLALLLAR